jgi:hypothetical protein
MGMRRMSSAAAVAAIVLAAAAPASAHADTDDDPCSLKMVIFCKLLPIAPNLDGDVDLTKPDDPNVAPAPTPPQPWSPPDICATGCV